MRAGASTATLQFPEGFFPVEGLVYPLDDLHARVLVIQQEERYALLTLELTSIPPDEISALNRILQEETGADVCRVLAVHTFSTPHFLPDHLLKTPEERFKKQQLQELVGAAARQAAAGAVSRMQEVSLRIGAAPCMVNSARDVETPEGWWVAHNGPGPVDHIMTVLQLIGTDDQIAAAMVHYAVQSSVLDGSQLRCGGKSVSGDLAGMMATELEKEWSCPVLFLIGAAGDQAPRQKAVGFRWENGAMVRTDLQDEAIPICKALAHEMAEAARAAAQAAQPSSVATLRWDRCMVTLPTKKIERDLKKLHPTRVPSYEPDGETEQPVELLQLGSLKLIGVCPELNCVTAQEICRGDDMIRIVTLWNGGAKYMADAASCERITYESQNSPFMKGAAELLCSAAKDLLRSDWDLTQ